MQECYAVQWATADDRFEASEPTPAEVRLRAGELAAAYNEPHNQALMDNTMDLSEDEVVELYCQMRAEGCRPFFLYHQGEFIGDADFRRLGGGSGEFAILIGPRAAQGKGLGTRLAGMLHVFAFQVLGLTQIFVTILPENTGSRRLFEKLGYQPDLSPQARSYTDHDTDLSLSISQEQLFRVQGNWLTEVQCRLR